MVQADLSFPMLIEQLAGALLVGLLIGTQREATPGPHPGLRDFLLIAVVGGLSGILGNPWLPAAGLLAVIVLLGILHVEQRLDRKGITTELAGAATFLLALTAATPALKNGLPIAIALAVLIAVFLEAKQRLQHLLRETITETEFNATLAFVTVVLVIYPVLPVGVFGPYMFFSPRQVWMFVILISSISYVGYFFEKFLGAEKGLVYTSILGGLASTTAATLHLARKSKEQPGDTFELSRAFVIANTVQFPRTYLIVALASPALAAACLWPLAIATATGVALAWGMDRWPHKPMEAMAIEHGNPFRIQPALRFGAMFTAVVFISKAASARAGAGAFEATSLLGGLVDVATVIAPAADLLRTGGITVASATIAVMLALGANAVLKLAIAALAGGLKFALGLLLPFIVWGASVGVGLWIGLR
jgi:uncharacterized membrane protein (DUF4010 family)